MNYKISGKVIRGDGYGRKIGFPTVNLDPALREGQGGSQLSEGVYCGDAILEGKKYRAGIVIGPGTKVEAHLLGFSGNAYEKEVSLEIKNFLREFKKFDTEEELIAQIRKDLQKCSQV